MIKIHDCGYSRGLCHEEEGFSMYIFYSYGATNILLNNESMLYLIYIDYKGKNFFATEMLISH